MVFLTKAIFSNFRNCSECGARTCSKTNKWNIDDDAGKYSAFWSIIREIEFNCRLNLQQLADSLIARKLKIVVTGEGRCQVSPIEGSRLPRHVGQDQPPAGTVTQPPAAKDLSLTSAVQVDNLRQSNFKLNCMAGPMARMTISSMASFPKLRTLQASESRRLLSSMLSSSGLLSRRLLLIRAGVQPMTASTATARKERQTPGRTKLSA